MFRSLLALLFALCALFHLRLSCTPDADNVHEQLTFIRRELDAGSAARMQALFPEGALFNYALYSLAAIELGRESDARYGIDAFDSADVRAPFDRSLTPAFGVFYVGWTSFVRGRFLERFPDDTIRARFESDCAALARAFETHPTPFLEAYAGQAWPVDSVVAMAALAVHDRSFTPRFTDTRARFALAMKQHLDPATGLLPHRVAPAFEGARGTSQSVIARFLPLVDPAFAKEHYDRFRTRFVATRLGVPGVLEFPIGTTGEGDVDSGPLILGVSASATVVTLGAAREMVDEDLADALAQVCEAFGAPLTFGGARRFGFGVVPVGDAFVVWSRSAPLHTQPFAPLVPWYWRWPLRVITALFVLLGLAALNRKQFTAKSS